jgi:ankyrin repeat protein
VNHQSNDGWTPLMYAARYSNKTSSLETVKLLIEKGADPSIANKGYTPLMAAAKHAGKDSSLETVQYRKRFFHLFLFFSISF